MYPVCACSHTTLGYDFIQPSRAGLGQYWRSDLQESPLQEVVLVIQWAILNDWASVPTVMEILVSRYAILLVPCETEVIKDSNPFSQPLHLELQIHVQYGNTTSGNTAFNLF